MVFFIPGFVLAIVAAAKSEGKKAISIVSAVFLILSVILMFLLLPCSNLISVGSSVTTKKLFDADVVKYYQVKKLAGSVLYGIIALLSGVASIVSAILNKN